MGNVIDRFIGEYRFLSNFGECVPFEHDGIRYTTSEHFYQAMKTLDLKERLKISQLPTPGQAKRAGAALTLRPDWNIVREDMMRLALKYKFRLDTDNGDQLLATGDKKLVEGNTWNDTYWGVNLKTGVGDNRLGKLLMERRRELQEELKNTT